MRIEEKKPEELQDTARPVYESDLTKEEKRRMEKEKIKGMSGTKKLGYLWTYYKIWLLVPLLVIVAVVTGVQIWQNAQEKPLLYVNISDTEMGSDEGMDRLSEDLRTLLGAENIHETVPVTNSILSSSNYEASVMMSVWLSTGEMDIVLCDEETYREYEAQGVFLSAEELFGDDLSLAADHIQDGMVMLDTARISAYGIVPYSPVCAGVLTTATHKEEAKEALLYLTGVR